MSVERPALRRYLVVLPTHNERENIEALVPQVLSLSGDIDVLIVDHGSTDGTPAAGRAMAERNERVRVLDRPTKEGLAAAYLTGFRQGLRDGYSAVCTMDADLQHDPRHLPSLLDALAFGDLVIGSRYCEGSGPHEWAFGRKLVSAVANLVARVAVDGKVSDATSGYRVYNRRLLSQLPLDRIDATGYAVIVELLYRSLAQNARVVERPIRFGRRTAGKSKIGLNEVFESLSTAWRLRVSSRRRRAQPN